MPRAFWKGAISFGMVVIPVRMYTATQRSTPSFRILHSKCHTRPRQVWYCPLDDEYFTSKETVRGYEYARDQYVLMTDEDFEKVSVPTTRAIEIGGFVKFDEIDPIYYYDTHYLEPEKLGIKPFSLLRQALLNTERVGIAKVSFQRREHLCCLRPANGTLYLHTLHYVEEVRSNADLVQATQEAGAEELGLAASLVNAMATSFHPEQYKDEYSLALERVIEAKLKGEEIKVQPPEKVEVPDLMSALRRSIEEAEQRAADREATPVK